MKVCYSLLLLLGIMLSTCVTAQDELLQASVPAKPVSTEYIHKISNKADELNEKLDRKTAKALQQWRKQEGRIKTKLAKKDSLKAIAVFGNAKQQFDQLEQKLQSKASLQQYIPSIDTLGSSLKFLQQNPQLLSNAKEAKEKLSNALSRVKGLEGQFQKVEDVKAFLKQRKQYLKEQLSQLGFTKELKKLNKQAYYYSTQVNEYKFLLKDHRKAERKALELLSKTKLFKDFMRKNSMLASLFRLPGDGPLQTSPGGGGLAGLQTRASVNSLIQQQIAIGGPNAQQQIQQNIQEAQSKINELKNKLAQYGNGSSEDEIPDFKPNNQKTKSFFQRLELGTNIQSQKATGWLPTTSDLGLSVGYKLNDKSIIGIGGSYKLGWGRDIRHINITHQGVSIRSFADWKIKGSFWLSGGYERNYRSEFRNVQALRNLNAWQQSGLVGLSKVVSLKTKFFKKTRMQLLWDFLSYEQVPRMQPVVFRVGYNF